MITIQNKQNYLVSHNHRILNMMIQEVISHREKKKVLFLLVLFLMQ